MSLNCSKISIAPMIDWTYSHFRFFMRHLAPKALLYSEMQTTGALINNPVRALSYNAQEHPLALQIGGSHAKTLADCARRAEEAGYDEVNLNIGCPSDKVQAGRFGACLMNEPDLVVACIKAMKNAVTIPVTSKVRIGIDEQDSYEFFRDFALKLVDAGSDKLIVHARKAWLHGLNPKQNRTIPPLHYDYVYRIKEELPHSSVVINGNINDIKDIKKHLNYVDGVMLGRLACDNSYQIARIHHELHPDSPLFTRSELVKSYSSYALEQHQLGVPLSLLVKPLFSLCHGMANARFWKSKLMFLLQSKEPSILAELHSILYEMEQASLGV